LYKLFVKILYIFFKKKIKNKKKKKHSTSFFFCFVLKKKKNSLLEFHSLFILDSFLHKTYIQIIEIMPSTSPFVQQLPCILLSTLVIGLFVFFYQQQPRKQLKEYFINVPQGTIVNSENKEGYANPIGNQQQLYVQPDVLSQPQGSRQLQQLSFMPPPTVVGSSDKGKSWKSKSKKEGFSPTQQHGLPLYQKEQDLDFIQVPGTYQSNPPPRFSPQGLGSNVRYNLPETQHQAMDPNNPLPYASMVECPKIKESFQYSSTSPSAKALEENSQLTEEKSHLRATNVLPSVSMASPTFFGSSQAGGDGEDGQEPTISYDRIMVTNLSRQRGNSDFIRGDLPIIPQKPVLDSSSFVMFRPSNGPEVLNPGALAVLAGAYNSTNRETVQLQMQNSGGTSNVGSGVQWEIPPQSAYGQQSLPMESRQQLMANITQSNEGGSSGLLGDVSFQKSYQTSQASTGGMSAQRMPY